MGERGYAAAKDQAGQQHELGRGVEEKVAAGSISPRTLLIKQLALGESARLKRKYERSGTNLLLPQCGLSLGREAPSYDAAERADSDFQRFECPITDPPGLGSLLELAVGGALHHMHLDVISWPRRNLPRS